MTDHELIQIVERLKNIMVSVSTGGQRIQIANADYQSTYQDANVALETRHIDNPNPYSDLWEWYGRWSSGDLPTYQSRRQFLSELYGPLLQELRNRVAGAPPESS